MSELPLTRHSLLIGLAQQSDGAWEEFLQVYEQAIYRYCRRRGLQDADAHDVTQAVLLAVHRRIESWDPDTSRGSFRGWLFRAARNIAVDALVDQSRWPARADTVQLANAPQGASGSDDFLREYQQTLFDWAAKRVQCEVKATTWKSFYLTAIEGRPPEEVAQQLGLSVGSVYTAKCRVVARIRERLAELGDDEAYVVSGDANTIRVGDQR